MLLIQQAQLKNNASGGIRFEDFQNFVSNIKDFELAIRSTVYIAGNFPRGEDRILAYEFALSCADRWITSINVLSWNLYRRKMIWKRLLLVVQKSKIY